MDKKQGVLEGQEVSTTNELSEKSCHALPITAEWINKIGANVQTVPSHRVCLYAEFVDISASATCCQPASFFPFLFFLQCLYNPATMEIWKARGHLFHPVGGSTHSHTQTRTADEQSLM